MRTALTAILVALCFPFPTATAAEGGSDATAPTTYLVAPPPEAARKVNLMPYEATLRTVAIVLASQGQDVRSIVRDQLDSLTDADYPRISFDFSAEAWPVIIQESAGKERVLGSVAFKTDSWADLVASVSKGASDVLGALGRVPRIKGVPLSHEQSRGIDKAVSFVCQYGPNGAAAAAREVRGVLEAAPSAAVLECAALPSCCVASIDLYGHFQFRDRVLAVPVSFAAAALLADEASVPEWVGTAATLSRGWAALLCGFPQECVEIISATGDLEGDEGALKRALEVFALRDHKRYEEENSISDASVIEQMAWIWAVEYLGIAEDYIGDIDYIMSTRRSSAVTQHLAVSGVGSGRQFTPRMMCLAFADAVYSALACPDLSFEKRRDLAAEYSGGSAAGDEEDLETAVTTLCTELSSRFDNEDFTAKDFKLMWDATDIALDAPAGPMVEGRWQLLEPWFVAQVMRGNAVQSAQLRAYLLQRMWSVPEQTIAFLAIFTDGTDETRQHGQYLRSIYFYFNDEYDRHTPVNREIFMGEIGVQPYQWWLFSEWWTDRWLEETGKNVDCVVRPIGAWQAGMRLASVYDKEVCSDELRALYALTLMQDPRNSIRGSVDVFGAPSGESMRANILAVADNYSALNDMASDANRKKDWDLTEEIGRVMIEKHPKQSGGYGWVADALENKDDIPGATKVLTEAMSALDWSVGYSNTEARLAQLLLKEGRVKEALERASHAAGSYSGSALVAYSDALIADGQVAEGIEVRRKCAVRYEGDVYYYLNVALRNGKDAAAVLEDAEDLMDEHGSGVDSMVVIAPFIIHEKFDEAESLLPKACRPDRVGEVERFLGIINFVKGDFEKSVQSFREGMDKGYVHTDRGRDARYAVYQAYMAMLMTGDKAGCERTKALIVSRKLDEWSEFRPIFDYIAGRVDRNGAIELAGTCVGNNLINVYLLFGVEEEAAGRTADAVEWYKKGWALEDQRERYPGTFMRRRLEHFGVLEAGEKAAE